MTDDRVYAAAFLRMHPTGKAVLSLSEASQGEESRLADIAADELGIPAEDVKVVHEDTDRFGVGHSFSTAPSGAVADNVAVTARRLRDRARLIAALMLDTTPESVQWDNGEFRAGDGSVRIQAVALRAFAGDALPEGVEGSMDAQTTYRVDGAEAASGAVARAE